MAAERKVPEQSDVPKIRRAHPSEAPLLSALAFSAKKSWGYPEDWMLAWRPALTITPEFIEQNSVFCALIAGSIAGFYALSFPPPALEHLWVTPARQRSGIGRALFAHARQTAGELGYPHFLIEADPNAAAFYASVGCTNIGGNSSTVCGAVRLLPVFQSPSLLREDETKRASAAS